MFARTEKDLALRATSAEEREHHLRRSTAAYGEAYRLTGGYWTGINAATLALISGDEAGAKALAASVRAQCLRTLEEQVADDYWLLATLGEAALVLGEQERAAEFYDRAAQSAGRRYADLQSSRRNARLILQWRNADATSIEAVLQIPRVVAFSGHMIDRPDRRLPRFPAEHEAAVAEAVRRNLDEVRAGFGYSSAACGADILFLEAMLERGAEVEVVLPYDREEFRHDSVAFRPDGNWSARFDAVLSRAARVVIASKQKLMAGGVSFEYANELVFGLATIRATQLETSLSCLAVWDRRAGDGAGGTASVVEHWQRAGHNPKIIDIGRIVAIESGAPIAPTSAGDAQLAPREADRVAGSKVLAMLFADAVGFSKLTEAEVPPFVRRFIGAIADLLNRYSPHVLARNTWGDGLYFVFETVESAASYALDLSDLVSGTDWSEHGLPSDLSLRIALHAGPVYEEQDPITDRTSFFGTHVSRAARIEPITPPGRVYASEPFAALAAAHQAKGFHCEYAGQTPMAKGFGTFPTYSVIRDVSRQLERLQST
jgi:class 3 adenylate cyclase